MPEQGQGQGQGHRQGQGQGQGNTRTGYGLGIGLGLGLGKMERTDPKLKLVVFEFGPFSTRHKSQDLVRKTDRVRNALGSRHGVFLSVAVGLGLRVSACWGEVRTSHKYTISLTTSSCSKTLSYGLVHNDRRHALEK
jgi:hypothetical protein